MVLGAAFVLAVLTGTLAGDLATGFMGGWWVLTFAALCIAQVWIWDLTLRLEQARRAAAHAVLRERLRFAADLHDIQGHHLQAIALKSELAGAAGGGRRRGRRADARGAAARRGALARPAPWCRATAGPTWTRRSPTRRILAAAGVEAGPTDAGRGVPSGAAAAFGRWCARPPPTCCGTAAPPRARSSWCADDAGARLVSTTTARARRARRRGDGTGLASLGSGSTPSAGASWARDDDRFVRRTRDGGRMIRLLLADDEELLRGALAPSSTSRPTCRSSPRPPTTTHAVRLAEQHRPDVAVLDLEMPPTDGLHAAAADPGPDRRHAPRIIIVTRHARPAVLRRALAAGVSGSCPSRRRPRGSRRSCATSPRAAGTWTRRSPRQRSRRTSAR